MPKIFWTNEEKETILHEVARLKKQQGLTESMPSMLVRAQRCLPVDRRRPALIPKGGKIPIIGGIKPHVRARLEERLAAIEALGRASENPIEKPVEAPTPPLPPPAPEPMRLSAQDELANYGLADLIAATLARLAEMFQPVPHPASHLVMQPTPARHAPVPYTSETTVARSRKVRIAGIGFLPSQQAAIQNRVPDVDFTWIPAEQSQTYVPPSMDFAVISRFCEHRWTEHCWKSFGQARAPRVTGGISEVTSTIRHLLSRPLSNGGAHA